MSVLPDLRDGLVRAAGRQQVSPRPTARMRRALRPVPVVLSLVAASVIAVIAVTELRHRPHRTGSAQLVTGQVPGRRELIGMLAPLRRPQTSVDLGLRLLSRPGGAGLLGINGTIDRALVRYAATTAWGERLFIVPMRPASAAQVAAADRRYPELRHAIARNASRGETVGLFSNGGGGGFATPAKLERYGVGETEGGGRSFAGGSIQTRVISLVPDGVARVAFLFARQPAGNQHGGPLYAHVLKVTVPVQDNIAAVQVKRESVGGGAATIWYNAAGHVIRRIGNFAALNRVVAVRKPGPQTAASKAAERDPSTPNHVWVAPSVGRLSTVFRVHFRVLLNGANYRYRVTGTRCPRYTFPGGTGNPNALRGSIWSDPLRAVQGQKLCPGIYHVSVAVFPRARPFGTATFTVR